MPEARQNTSKLAEMFARASSFSALAGMAVDVVGLFMALLSFVESAPRAYRLKAGNAAHPISTSIGTIPSRPLQLRQESLSKVVREIAWKAQVRLCARYRRLMAAGKRQTLITTAIAREMAAFLWAIGHEVQPSSVA